MNTSYLFHKLLGTALAILLLLGVVSVPVFAEPTRQDDIKMPVHIIIGVDGEWSDMAFNRSAWEDYSATNPLSPGMALQDRDFVEISGSTTLRILCADLSASEMLANSAPECGATDTPAFINMDTPLWAFANVDVLITSDAIVMPDDLADSDLIPIMADDATRAQITQTLASIGELGLEAGTQAYVEAYALASQGIYLDAVNTLLAVEDLQCTDRRNFVEVTDGNSIYENPSVYLRMGEWYAILGNLNVSARYLQCAGELAEANADLLNVGLAYSRLAVVTEDAEARTASYQAAIDTFNALSADTAVADLLDACGSANCTAP